MRGAMRAPMRPQSEGVAACGKSAMSWSMNVADGGYGFNVTTDRGKPLVLFAYETREVAEAAAQQVEAAVERAVLVRPFPA
jgi:hypothetical protein